MPLRRISLITILCLICIGWLQANPTIGSSDSTKVKVRRKSSLNDTWYYGAEPNKRYTIDTSIAQLHRFDIVHRDGTEYFNLGNTGSAAYPIVFGNTPTIGFNMGFRQFDLYRYNLDSVRYYQVIRPYTELFYGIGSANEQVFQGRFANSHKTTFLYGVDFRRSNSKGTFSNQRALDNCFNLYGIYNSKNKRFGIQTDLLYNSFEVNENGGLATDIFFKDTILFTKSLAPTKLINAQLSYQEINWFLKGSYNIGKKYTERVNDSTVKQVLLPVFKISYRLDIEHNRYYYLDTHEDSSYYPSYFKVGDTIRYFSKFLKIGNALFLDYNAKKLTSDSTYKELNFLMGAALHYDYYNISEFNLPSKFSTLYVSGYLKSNPALNPRLLYRANLIYYFAGYNLNDLQADGQVGLDLYKYGRIIATASYSLRQSDWVMHSFRPDTNRFSFNNNFPKMSIIKFGGDYSIDKIGIKISAYNYTLKNYQYYAAPDVAAYESNAINILVLSFANRFGIKGFHIDNDIWFQKSAGSSVIRLPLFATKHSVYYERHIFKHVLWFAFGVDLRYYTPFLANGYFPLTGQFYKQDYQEMKFYPVLDIFLNVKVKSLRVFLVGTNISSFFGKQKGYYTGYLYPAADATFKFGLAWRFFE